MINSRTRYEDYRAMDLEMDTVTLAFMKGEIDSSERLNRFQSIQKKYAGRVFEEDFHLFDDELKFKIFLKQIEPDPLEVENVIQHERAHFEESKKLGSNPMYGAICFYKDVRGRRVYGYGPLVRFTSQNPSDISRIVSAPEVLSEYDKRLLG